MAGKPMKKTEKTIDAVKTIVEEKTSSPDLSQILEMMSKLQEELNILSDENKMLKQQVTELNTIEEGVLVTEEIVESTPVDIDNEFLLTDKNRMIRVYHMQEMVGGMATIINLSNTKRRLMRMGELITLKINDFEELVGRYRSFFERGILAVDAGDLDYAQLYDLPIYDTKMKKQYNAKVLKDVVNYNYEKLQEFYKNLSENNKRAFLSYWLGKVYDKEDGYYNEEKMRWLNNLSGTETFSSILFEIEQNRTRERTSVIETK
jgi:hypothetical protein